MIETGNPEQVREYCENRFAYAHDVRHIVLAFENLVGKPRQPFVLFGNIQQGGNDCLTELDQGVQSEIVLNRGAGYSARAVKHRSEIEVFERVDKE